MGGESASRYSHRPSPGRGGRRLETERRSEAWVTYLHLADGGFCLAHGAMCHRCRPSAASGPGRPVVAGAGAYEGTFARRAHRTKPAGAPAARALSRSSEVATAPNTPPCMVTIFSAAR
jgi:hypothetical protein